MPCNLGSAPGSIIMYVITHVRKMPQIDGKICWELYGGWLRYVHIGGGGHEKGQAVEGCLVVYKGRHTSIRCGSCAL